MTRGATAWPALLAAVLAITGCASGAVDEPQERPAAASAAPTPTPTPTPTPAPTRAPTPTPTPTAALTPTTTLTPTPTPAPASQSAIRPRIQRIPDAQWDAMVATGAWRPGCPAGRAQLRRVSVPYVGFDGATHQGVLVVNADVAASVVRIFTRLHDAGFPIRRMVPIEQYGGDDNASMADDNTSAFNCRRPGQANAPSAKSPHANGRAIDVNPLENPWKDPRCDCFQPDPRQAPRHARPGVIVKGGVVWQAFTDEGWIWQDSTTPDYQHFDTGYPSRPWRSR